MAKKSIAKLKRAPRSSPKDPSQFKKMTLRLRVSPEEYETFTRSAEEQGYTASGLIRSVLEEHGYILKSGQDQDSGKV